MLKSLAIIFVLCFCLFSSISYISIYYSEANSRQEFCLINNELSSNVVYERINLDGVWWIVVYEDGVKIQEYIDPDQS